MAPHIEPSCASGDNGCIKAGPFFGVIFTAVIISIAAFVTFTLLKKQYQKKQDIDVEIGNEQSWFHSNYGAHEMQDLPPQYTVNPSNTPQGTSRVPKSASDLWRQRGFQMPGVATRAGSWIPPVPPTIQEEADIGMQPAETQPVQRTMEKSSGTPIADRYMSPGASFAAARRWTPGPLYSVSRQSPYIDQRRPSSPQGSIKSPSGTPIADSYTSPRLSFAASRASSYSKQGRTHMPSLSVDTQGARQPTVEDEMQDDLGARPPNPQQTSSVERRTSKFQEQLESPTLAGPEAFEEIELSPPPRKSTQSAFGSPSRQSFSSNFSGGLPSSWGRVVKGRFAE